MRRALAVGLVAVLVPAWFAGSAAGAARSRSKPAPVPPNVDISQRHLNESEEAIAVNPTNPQNIVEYSNVDLPLVGLWLGVSFDGGQTWATSLIADDDNLGDGCCDPTLSFDGYGNLWMSYLYNVENEVPVALSTDGGLTFDLVANISNPGRSADAGRRPQGERGLYRFVDQPTIISGENQVWVVFNAGGPLVAAGAPVTGLGQFGEFQQEVVHGTNNCTYGDIAIGPAGQVMQVCTLTESGQGGGKIFESVDPDGLGPAGFGKRVFVAATHVGGFDFIPPQPDRSVDAEPGLAWDRTGGPHDGRAYVVYTKEQKNEKGDTDIYVRHSDDDGRRSPSTRPRATSPWPGTTRATTWGRAARATPTGCPTRTPSSGARSAPTGVRASVRTSRSARARRTRRTPTTGSTTATTAGCRSSAGWPIRRGRTTRTARGRTPTGP